MYLTIALEEASIQALFSDAKAAENRPRNTLIKILHEICAKFVVLISYHLVVLLSLFCVFLDSTLVQNLCLHS